MKTSERPVIVEHRFKASGARLWEALTSASEMRQWFFDNIPSFEDRVGFETQFEVVSGDRTFTHVWEVVEVIPLKKIKYRWNYKEYQGDSYILFELSHIDDGTLLRLSTEVIEDFPENIPEFERDSCKAGWEYFIKERLPKFLKSD